MTVAITASLAASAARTTSGNSGQVTVEGPTFGVMLNVTAVSGTTPSMTLSIEWSPDGVTWYPGETADAFTAITATGARAKAFPVKGPYARASWAITGTTPSFTFVATSFNA